VSHLQPSKTSKVFECHEIQSILLEATEPDSQQTRAIILRKGLSISVQQAVVDVLEILAPETVAKWLELFVDHTNYLQQRYDKVGEAIHKWVETTFPEDTLARYTSESSNIKIR
jgi:hypothetical protein